MHNIQIIANDFNGSNSLFSQIVSKFFFSSFLRLSLPKDKGFFFVLQQLFSYLSKILVKS